MTTYIDATLGGLSALAIGGAIVSFLPITFAEKSPTMQNTEFPSEKFKARGSGRDEEQILISNSESEPPQEKPSPKTEIASKAGDAQTTHKDGTPPPRGETRRD